VKRFEVPVKFVFAFILLVSVAFGDLPQRESPHLLHLSEGSGNHRITSRIQTVCPDGACSLCANAVVKLKLLVAKGGRVKDIVPVAGDPQLVQAAINAVSQWRYEPYILVREPVEFETRTTIRSWSCRN